MLSNMLIQVAYNDITMIFFSYKGRINRQTYWLYSLGLIGLALLQIGFIHILEGLVNMQVWGIGTFLVMMFALVFVITDIWINMSLQAKRWHDVGQTGWLSLLAVIPYVNIGIFVILGFIKGTNGVNRFGADPLLEVDGASKNQLEE